MKQTKFNIYELNDILNPNWKCLSDNQYELAAINKKVNSIHWSTEPPDECRLNHKHKKCFKNASLPQ
jgi:hypothetical protein